MPHPADSEHQKNNRLFSPVTALCQQLGYPLQPKLVHLVKPIQNSTVHIDDGHHLALTVAIAGRSTDYDWDNNLAPTIRVTGNVAREGVDVGHKLGTSFARRGPTYAAPEGDGLAGYFSLERTQDELRLLGRGGWVKHIEARPVHGVAGGREGVVSVPEERGCVGKVTGPKKGVD